MDGSIPSVPTVADLARRAAFRLGAALVDPASREVIGPGGRAAIEPRVMQVLVVLSDADGGVVTREELIRLCWNSQVVGEDALNRAVGEVRRVARTLAAGSFGVETIPRTGYRLTRAALEPPVVDPPEPMARKTSVFTSRRTLLAAAGLGLAGTGAWAIWPDADARRAADLAAQARLALNDDLPEGAARGVALLRQATDLSPQDPRLWGALALAWRAQTEFAPPTRIAQAVDGCELAAARALALDAGQADAQVALIQLRSTYGDWLEVESRLRAILARDSANIAAASALAMLFQAVGRTRDSAAFVGRLAAREPLSPGFQYRQTYMLWSLGRLDEADRTIDRAMELWPRHPGVWFARLWLTGFTGRTPLAVAQIDDVESRPPTMSEASAAVLRLSMQAIGSRDPARVKAATAANLTAAMTGPGGSVNAIMILTALGRLDEAFEVADGYLLRRGSKLMPLNYTPGQTWVNDQRHRKIMMLFVPVAEPMRADPRFIDLCRGAGLVDYWRRSGRWADFLGSRRVA